MLENVMEVEKRGKQNIHNQPKLSEQNEKHAKQYN